MVTIKTRTILNIDFVFLIKENNVFNPWIQILPHRDYQVQEEVRTHLRYELCSKA